MNDMSLEMLVERISRLERQTRTWKIACTGILVALLALGASSGSRNDEIVAKKITIEGNQGEPLVTLGSWGQGRGGLILMQSAQGAESTVESMDRDIALRKELGDSWGAAIIGLPSSAELLMKSRNNKAGRAGDLRIEPTGIGFFTTKGRLLGLNAIDPYISEYQGTKQQMPGRVGLLISDSSDISESSAQSQSIDLEIAGNTSSLYFSEVKAEATKAHEPISAHENTRASITALRDGQSSLALYDESGKLKELAIVLKKRGRLEAYSASGKAQASLAPDSLSLFDENGILRTILGTADLEVARTGATERTSLSSLTFFDKQGKVLARQP